MQHTLPFYQVDAFADKAFCGNPAAVVLVTGLKRLHDETLQRIATENNLAETAFVFSEQGGFESESTFVIRWFSPSCEVPMCGHATLASAKVLIECLGNINDTLTFDSTMGRGTISISQQQGSKELEMSLPASDPIDPIPSSSLSIAQECIGGHMISEITFSAASGYLVLRLDATPMELEGITPDFTALRSKGQGILGVIITCQGPDEDPNDFYSRFFGPWIGIDEDHVTGSSHAVLGPYWLKRLSLSKFGSETRAMRACQCSARRGLIGVRLVKGPGVNSRDEVALSGKAVVVIRGEIAFSV